MSFWWQSKEENDTTAYLCVDTCSKSTWMLNQLEWESEGCACAHSLSLSRRFLQLFLVASRPCYSVITSAEPGGVFLWVLLVCDWSACRASIPLFWVYHPRGLTLTAVVGSLVAWGGASTTRSKAGRWFTLYYPACRCAKWVLSIFGWHSTSGCFCLFFCASGIYRTL